LDSANLGSAPLNYGRHQQSRVIRKLADHTKYGCAENHLSQRATIAITANLSCNTTVRTISDPILRTLLALAVCATCCAIAFATPQSDKDQRPGLLPRLGLADPPAIGPHDPPPVAKIVATQAMSDQPLWRVDLHTMGFPTGNSPLQWQRGLGSFDTVDFVSDGVVAATFVTQEPAAGLQRRNELNRARPYRLHAIFMDAATGAVLKTLEWPGDDLKMGIFPRYDGSFVFFSTEHLVLYSPDWKPVKEVALLALQQPNSTLKEIAESPSGKIIEVRILNGNSLMCLRIQTDTLTAERDICSTFLGFSVSDDELASADGVDAFNLSGENRELHPEVHKFTRARPGQKGPSAKVVLTAERGDRKGLLCDSDSVMSCALPTFISNDMVVVHNQALLGLFDISGIPNHEKAKFEFQRAFGKASRPGSRPSPEFDWISCVGRPIRPSSNGQRFAVAVNAPVHPDDHRTLEALFPEFLPAPMPDYVDIFDILANQQTPPVDLHCIKPQGPCDWWIFRLNNTDKQFKQIWGLGLSPNGERLVVDSGGVIQTYKLPPLTGRAIAAQQ
jgi:hypothetical protein